MKWFKVATKTTKEDIAEAYDEGGGDKTFWYMVSNSKDKVESVVEELKSMGYDAQYELARNYSDKEWGVVITLTDAQIKELEAL
jgi:uncharacterized protein with ACT and thioredoxin-like domain